MSVTLIRPRIRPRHLLLVLLAISIVVSAGLMIAAPKPPMPVGVGGAMGGAISNPSLPVMSRTPSGTELPPSAPLTNIPAGS
jgi:hypothetical protein